MATLLPLAIVLAAGPAVGASVQQEAGAVAGLVSATELGARCDGRHDDTAAIQGAIDRLAKSGGTVQLPAGVCRANVILAASNVSLFGAGRSASPTQGGPGGTVLAPADVGRPVVQIGDGKQQTNSVSFGRFTVSGDPKSPHDGIVIHGAYLVNGWDFTVENCGADNIRIDSSPERASFYINLSSFASRWGRRAGVRLVRGETYVSAVNLTGFMVQGWPADGTYALATDVAVNVAQAWIQVGGSRKGHVLLKARGARGALSCANVNFDSNASTDVLIEVDGPERALGRYLAGTYGVDGMVQIGGGKPTRPRRWSDEEPAALDLP